MKKENNNSTTIDLQQSIYKGVSNQLTKEQNEKEMLNSLIRFVRGYVDEYIKTQTEIFDYNIKIGLTLNFAYRIKEKIKFVNGDEIGEVNLNKPIFKNFGLKNNEKSLDYFNIQIDKYMEDNSKEIYQNFHNFVIANKESANNFFSFNLLISKFGYSLN